QSENFETESQNSLQEENIEIVLEENVMESGKKNESEMSEIEFDNEIDMNDGTTVYAVAYNKYLMSEIDRLSIKLQKWVTTWNVSHSAVNDLLTWSDYKYNLKRKAAALKQNIEKTGGGPSEEKDLTELELKLLDCWGNILSA
ncbi:hypothetical protein NQ314_008047, partial [Rhamnusium bicolor]